MSAAPLRVCRVRLGTVEFRPMNAPHQPRFVHLRLHTEYSISDGISLVDQAISRAAADGMPALGISDLANLFGMVKFYKGARNKGVKPIIGCDVWITNEVERDKPARALLICRNRKGYGQLCELLTRAYLENKHRGRAEMRREWFEGGAVSDLICLSGAMMGDVGVALGNGNIALAEQLASDWARLFPDAYYIELQRAGLPGGERYVRDAWLLAARLALPVVATHPEIVALGDIMGEHHPGTCAQPGQHRQQHVAFQGLGLVDDDERVVQGPAADVGERQYLEHAAGEHLLQYGRAGQTLQGVEDRLGPGAHLVALAAGQVAQLLATDGVERAEYHDLALGSPFQYGFQTRAQRQGRFSGTGLAAQ